MNSINYSFSDMFPIFSQYNIFVKKNKKSFKKEIFFISSLLFI